MVYLIKLISGGGFFAAQKNSIYHFGTQQHIRTAPHEGRVQPEPRLLNSYMSEQINSAETSDQCLKNISYQLYFLSPYERFCICLREDWGDSESLLVKGYPDRMKLVFDTRKDSVVCSDTYVFMFDTEKLQPEIIDKLISQADEVMYLNKKKKKQHRS